jgi:PPOX class probable F420-dependent enzyme
MAHPDTRAWTDLEGRYLSITSFRRDGTGVATPVWFVRDGARLLVQTDADSYKVRRIRHNPHVSIAICNAAGRRRGQPVPATATFLPAAELPRAEQLLASKYHLDLLLFTPLRAIQTRLGRRRGPSIGLAITPDPLETGRTQRWRSP